MIVPLTGGPPGVTYTQYNMKYEVMLCEAIQFTLHLGIWDFRETGK